MTIHGAQTLEGFAAETEGCNGLRVTSLDAGTVLHVQTLHSHYRLVLSEVPNQVVITGGALGLAPVEARIVGATATGWMVKTGWICVGLRLEFRVGRHRITTSPVERVSIEVEPTMVDRSVH